MAGATTSSRLGRVTLLAVVLLLVGFLALRALWPKFAADFWFGRPDSWQTVVILLAVMSLLAVWTFTSRNGAGTSAVPAAIIAGLGATSLVLGFSSYWHCYDGQHPRFFTALTFTGALLKGAIGDQSIGEPGQPTHPCPMPTPVALDVARLSAQAAIFLGLATVAIAVFRSQTDRIRVRRARSVTVVVGIDDDTSSMISAIASTMSPGGTLVVITDDPERPWVYAARRQAARILAVDFDHPNALTDVPLWSKLDRLYLLSADPSANLQRLAAVTTKVPDGGRLPLIVRIDDPWQAEVSRAQQFGDSDRRWAADVVGKYEVTARRLLDAVTAVVTVDRVVVCGASPLTLALCADVAQRGRERDFYSAPDQSPLPSLTLLADNAKEYLDDHEFHQRQLGNTVRGGIDAIGEPPTMSTLLRVIGADDRGIAVIFVDSDSSIDATIGTRLAARFRDMPVYTSDPAARATEDRVPIIGRLRTYRVAMDVSKGQAHDAWERAAMLIHARWAATQGAGAASLPWPQLDEFYRESNRRLVRNTLRVVEQLGDHTWSGGSGPAVEVSAAELTQLPPLERLLRLGFDEEAALNMVRAEHEDWYRYYRTRGWQHGETRNDAKKIHDGLIDWAHIVANPELLDRAVDSVAATILQLSELGYRSRPAWESFRRSGTVTAGQRDAPWTWMARGGEAMHGNAGDWEVRDSDGNDWSVADGIFQDSYEPVDETRKLWRRTGLRLARPARIGERIDSLEGPKVAAAGEWVVRGPRNEEWLVPADVFAQSYERIAAS